MCDKMAVSYLSRQYFPDISTGSLEIQILFCFLNTNRCDEIFVLLDYNVYRVRNFCYEFGFSNVSCFRLSTECCSLLVSVDIVLLPIIALPELTIKPRTIFHVASCQISLFFLVFFLACYYHRLAAVFKLKTKNYIKYVLRM